MSLLNVYLSPSLLVYVNVVSILTVLSFDTTRNTESDIKSKTITTSLNEVFFDIAPDVEEYALYFSSPSNIYAPDMPA